MLHNHNAHMNVTESNKSNKHRNPQNSIRCTTLYHWPSNTAWEFEKAHIASCVSAPRSSCNRPTAISRLFLASTSSLSLTPTSLSILFISSMTISLRFLLWTFLMWFFRFQQRLKPFSWRLQSVYGHLWRCEAAVCCSSRWRFSPPGHENPGRSMQDECVHRYGRVCLSVCRLKIKMFSNLQEHRMGSGGAHRQSDFLVNTRSAGAAVHDGNWQWKSRGSL